MPDNRERIWSWYGISMVIGVSESTARRWANKDSGLKRVIRRYGRRVFSYRADLDYWRLSKQR